MYGKEKLYYHRLLFFIHKEDLSKVKRQSRCQKTKRNWYLISTTKRYYFNLLFYCWNNSKRFIKSNKSPDFSHSLDITWKIWLLNIKIYHCQRKTIKTNGVITISYITSVTPLCVLGSVTNNEYGKWRYSANFPFKSSLLHVMQLGKWETRSLHFFNEYFRGW